MDQKDLNITFKQGLRWMGWSFLMVLFSTCQDSLEEVPKAFLTPQNFYETAEDALLAVNASYDHMASGTSNRDFGGVYFNNYWVCNSNSHCLLCLLLQDIYIQSRTRFSKIIRAQL